MSKNHTKTIGVLKVQDITRRFKVSLGEENVEELKENHRFLIGLKYCLTRFRFSQGKENVEKTKENHRFLIRSGYCLMGFKVSLGEESVEKP